MLTLTIILFAWILLVGIAFAQAGCGMSNIPADRKEGQPENTPNQAGSAFRFWDWIAYLVTACGLVVQAYSGLAADWFYNGVRGMNLVLHGLGAILLTPGVMLLAVRLAERSWSCFSSYDLNGACSATRGFHPFQKRLFWLFVILSITLIGSMLASMNGRMGQDSIEALYEIHKWSGTLLLAVALIHLLALPITMRGRGGPK